MGLNHSKKDCAEGSNCECHSTSHAVRREATSERKDCASGDNCDCRRFTGDATMTDEPGPLTDDGRVGPVVPTRSLVGTSAGNVVYADGYNIRAGGMEKLHSFDAQKWGRVYRQLMENHTISETVTPSEATTDDLLKVHSAEYLDSLRSSWNVARIVEVAAVAVIPANVVDSVLLQPMRLQTGGTVLAAELALHHGSAVNIGGGFHHACGNRGGGFCVYADITLAIRNLVDSGRIRSALIVDLDAHQGNGHERDFATDGRVKILDMYNADIYPQDHEARNHIDYEVRLHCGASDGEYLYKLEYALKDALGESVAKPDLVFYNAGTDCLQNDRLGQMNVSAEAIVTRDEMVFAEARKRGIPIVMATSGGYTPKSADVIAASITNLCEKGLLAKN